MWSYGAQTTSDSSLSDQAGCPPVTHDPVLRADHLRLHHPGCMLMPGVNTVIYNSDFQTAVIWIESDKNRTLSTCLTTNKSTNYLLPYYLPK